MIENNGDIRSFSPGATIGILGSGQLGRMIAIAAKQMGYRIHVFSPAAGSPAGQVADLEVLGEFDQLDRIEFFAKQVDVVTVETENVPLPTLAVAAGFGPAYPGQRTLEVCQNRGHEKQFLTEHEIPTNRFEVVNTPQALKSACQTLMPAVVKTVTGGYDGKGQCVVQSIGDTTAAEELLDHGPVIVEQWVDFDWEFSIVAARNARGQCVAYPSIRNEHQAGILDVSLVPSGLPEAVNHEATDYCYRIMQALGTVGVLTVEFFFSNGRVLVNEIAPRPHNSGHLTIEGNVTSQFEQHVRAVCGLAFGSTRLLSPAAMANLLGDQWEDGPPNWSAAISMPETKLHLYGKQTPGLKRKMGHLTATAENANAAQNMVLCARQSLKQTRTPSGAGRAGRPEQPQDQH